MASRGFVLLFPNDVFEVQRKIMIQGKDYYMI